MNKKKSLSKKEKLKFYDKVKNLSKTGFTKEKHKN